MVIGSSGELRPLVKAGLGYHSQFSGKRKMRLEKAIKESCFEKGDLGL
jgi:hypothetical protein